MRFVGRVVVHHGIDDLAGFQMLEPLLDRNHLAARWKDRADAHQVELRDASVAQRKLERCQFLAVPPNALGQKDPVSYRPHLSLLDFGSSVPSGTAQALGAKDSS